MRTFKCVHQGVLLSLAVLALCLAGCGKPSAPPKTGLSAFAGIPPIQFFIERIGGESVAAGVLIESGQSPHTYSPTAQQMNAVARADLYCSVGMPFEEHLLEKLREINPKMKTVNVTDGITFRRMTADEAAGDHDEDADAGHDEHADHDHAAGAPDPHVWLSPANAEIISRNICAALADADPAHKGDYEKNLDALVSELTALDAKLRTMLAPLKGQEFMVYHPAFGYFGDAYGLKQAPVEIEGKAPSMKALSEFIKHATEHKVRMIFVQPQFSTKSADAIAEQVGAAVVPLDPLARDYLSNMRHIAEELAKMGGT